MIKDREFYFSFPTFYFSDHLNSITMEPINTKHHSLWNIQPRRNNYPSESILLLMKNSLVINHSYRNIPINSWDSWFDLSLIHFFFVVPPRISSVREKFHPFFFLSVEKVYDNYEDYVIPENQASKPWRMYFPTDQRSFDTIEFFALIAPSDMQMRGRLMAVGQHFFAMYTR